MAIGKDKVNIKISLHKKAFDVIETASRTWKMTKSELIEQATCGFIVAQVKAIQKEAEELEKKVSKEKK